MIQAEIGGAARVDPGNGVQRPGFLIRDFTLPAANGESVKLSGFRGRSNLVVVFAGCSDAVRGLLAEMALRAHEFSEQNATVLAVVPHGPKADHSIPIENNSLFFVLFDETLRVYNLSGAADDDGRPQPLVYVTDRFGEIAAAYAAPAHAMPPSASEILAALEFVNQQCPECEPPEWPRY